MSVNPVAQDIARDLAVAYLSRNEIGGSPETIAEFISTLYKEIYEKVKNVK